MNKLLRQVLRRSSKTVHIASVILGCIAAIQTGGIVPWLTEQLASQFVFALLSYACGDNDELRYRIEDANTLLSWVTMIASLVLMGVL